MSRRYPYETPELRAKVRALVVEVRDLTTDPKERDLAEIYLGWLDNGGPDGWVMVDDDKLALWTRALERVRRGRASSEAPGDAPEKAR